MKIAARALLYILCLCSIPLTLPGCSSVKNQPLYIATALAQPRPWMPEGPERLHARALSLNEARRNLWAQVMQEKTSNGQSIQQIVLLYPEFNSRLRGIVALARVESFEEREDGALLLQIQIEHSEVQNLIREYTERR